MDPFKKRNKWEEKSSGEISMKMEEFFLSIMLMTESNIDMQ